MQYPNKIKPAVWKIGTVKLYSSILCKQPDPRVGDCNLDSRGRYEVVDGLADRIHKVCI